MCGRVVIVGVPTPHSWLALSLSKAAMRVADTRPEDRSKETAREAIASTGNIFPYARRKTRKEQNRERDETGNLHRAIDLVRSSRSLADAERSARSTRARSDPRRPRRSAESRWRRATGSRGSNGSWRICARRSRSRESQRPSSKTASSSGPRDSGSRARHQVLRETSSALRNIFAVIVRFIEVGTNAFMTRFSRPGTILERKRWALAQAFVPPSTVRFAPVMYEDSGPATNATNAATS
jgi:hypothetical protein